MLFLEYVIKNKNIIQKTLTINLRKSLKPIKQY